MAAGHRKIAEEGLQHKTEMRVASFKVERPEERKRLTAVIKHTIHVRNMILLQKKILDTEGKESGKYMLNPAVVRAVFAGADGGKNAEKVIAVIEDLKEHKIFQDFTEMNNILKEKNIHGLAKKIRAGFKSFFTKRDQGNEKADPPKPKKVAKFHNYSIAIDQDAFSLKRKNLLRINLNKKMEDFHLNHDKITEACGSLEAVQSLEISLQHDEIYFRIGYNREVSESAYMKKKFAGIDLGLKNTASLFISDRETPSLILEGSPLIQYNANFNRRVSRLRSRRDQLKNIEIPTEEEEKQLQALCRSISRQYGDRHQYFSDSFHKMAMRIMEYCRESRVTDLYMSRNLGFLKQEEGKNARFSQKFCEIPMVKLIDHLKDKGTVSGVRVHDDIDEAYSSKVSCLSGDVCDVQVKASEIAKTEDATARKKAKRKLSDAFGGRRGRRDCYTDHSTGRTFLADLNGAANHVKLGLGPGYDLSWLSSCLWKLANPIVFKCDSMFLDLRFRKPGYREKRPESRQKSWCYATWSPV